MLGYFFRTFGDLFFKHVFSIDMLFAFNKIEYLRIIFLKLHVRIQINCFEQFGSQATCLIPTKSPQNFSLGRFRHAESESEVQNLESFNQTSKFRKTTPGSSFLYHRETEKYSFAGSTGTKHTVFFQLFPEFFFRVFLSQSLNRPQST